MFGSMVMSYSLLLFNYAASVVFTSSYVLLMFHLLAPGSMRIIGERAIDTVVGCMIAIAASRLFPYWEYRLMGKQVADMLTATRKYFEAVWRAGRGMSPPPVPAADGAAVVPVVAAAIETRPRPSTTTTATASRARTYTSRSRISGKRSSG